MLKLVTKRMHVLSETLFQRCSRPRYDTCFSGWFLTESDINRGAFVFV